MRPAHVNESFGRVLRKLLSRGRKVYRHRRGCGIRCETVKPFTGRGRTNVLMRVRGTCCSDHPLLWAVTCDLGKT